LVVHRILDSCLNNEVEPFSTDVVNSASRQCNVRKFASRDAQDASQNLFLVAYLSRLQVSSPSGILAEAWVNGIGSRAFDVLVPRFGIQSRVWLEDSMDLKQVAGIEADAEKGKLKIHWKIKHVEITEGVDPEGEERTMGLDPKLHKTQMIGMFDKVEVLIVANMSQSPPSYKLFAVCP
jgi:DIS3-like exonuclease 2 C terminal/S1 domain